MGEKPQGSIKERLSVLRARQRREELRRRAIMIGLSLTGAGMLAARGAAETRTIPKSGR
ncbi:hypothetical protein [Nonomuraea sp. NPDC048901]|uniref:hypothetical protein n=1 Tax=Nonomuraea sp. NPDC048901 TaxID=3155627 RepID=UPI0033F873CB